MAPIRMLIGEEALDRVQGRLSEAGLMLEPVILCPDGRLQMAGSDISLDAAAPEAAWLSPELYLIKQSEMLLDFAKASPGLRWMQTGQAGFDNPVFAILARQGVRISMSKGPIPAIGEYVLAAVLDHFQRGPERRAAQAAQHWGPLPFREVDRSRWLCIGFGAIGRETARRARALGANVTGVRRSGGADEDADQIITPDRLLPALGEADVVILSVPLTPESDGAYGADFFAAMRPDTLFINVGRGALLDEDALRAALDVGCPHHAVLDVTRVEPLPKGEWQWSHPRLTLTAHTSGIGSGLMDRTDAIFVENLANYIAARPLKNELDVAVFGLDIAA